MGDISKNFNLKEFEASSTARARKIDNTIKDETVKQSIISLVENILQPLRDKYGKAIRINSGYRCQELNKAVGGVPTSQHTKGEASDLGVDKPKELFELIKEMDLPYDQLILYPTFVHVSHKLNGKQRKMIIIK